MELTDRLRKLVPPEPIDLEKLAAIIQKRATKFAGKISRAVSIWIALTKRYGSTLRQKY